MQRRHFAARVPPFGGERGKALYLIVIHGRSCGGHELPPVAVLPEHSGNARLDICVAQEQKENIIPCQRPPMITTQQKLEILADAAKYDASCSSSGAEKRN